MVVKSGKLNVLQMGNDINIPSNGMITVMRMICSSSYLTKNFDLDTLFFSFPSFSKSKKIFGTIKALIRFLIIFYNFDIFHIHHSTGFNFLLTSFFSIFVKAFNKKLILHNHGADFHEFYQTRLTFTKSIIKKTFENADAVITLSESWKDWHCKNISRKARWIVMNNPSPLLQPNRRNELRYNKLSVLYMSRLEKRKGVYDFLDIIPGILNQYKQMNFIFAGDGDIKEVYTILEHNNLSNNVKLLGWVNNDEKIRLLKNTDIFVLPSYNEGLPMALLEAMTFGIPCIVSDVGGIPELISNGENGILFKAGDKLALANAIFTLASKPKLRDDIGVSAYQTIKHSYSLDSYVSRLAGLYLKLTAFSIKTIN